MSHRDLSDQDLSELLCESAIDHEVGQDFVNRVVREAKLDFHSRTLKFWAPVLFGAVLTAVGLLAAIEAITYTPARAPYHWRGHEARNTQSSDLKIPDSFDTVVR